MKRPRSKWWRLWWRTERQTPAHNRRVRWQWRQISRQAANARREVAAIMRLLDQ